MDFLESLYNIENFGIYLFIVIGILFILFLVILFFGKKDEKKRKLEETKKVEVEPITEDKVVVEPILAEEQNANANTLFQEISEPSTVDVPASSETMEKPVLEPIKTPSLSDIALEQISEMNTPNVEKTTEFDFDALAAEINKELESIEKPQENAVNETVSPFNYSIPEAKEEVVLPKEIPEPKIEKTMPTVFSSVYVDREKEKPMVEKAQETLSTPIAPKIELPKIIDLPKKNHE